MTETTSAAAAWRSLAGGRVLLPSGCGFPIEFVRAMKGALGPEQRVELIAGIVLGGYDFLTELAPQVCFTTWQYAPGASAVAGTTFLPLRYSQVIETFAPGGAYPADAIVLHLAPPDVQGYCSLGVSPSYLAPLATSGLRLIGVVNAQMPVTGGHRPVHVDELDLLVHVDSRLETFTRPRSDETDVAVATNVAGLIPDGATLQIGLGGIPEALPGVLGGDHRDLGLFGMMTDGAMDLMRAGVVNGRCFTPHPGSVEVGEIVGSQALFDFVAGRTDIRVVGSDYAMAPETFAGVPQLVAINSAIEVDLGGQVNAETVGRRIVSGAGGQCDYMQGAMLSPGGLSIIALRSTARGGQSRIVACLAEGSVVTTPRTAVSHVVTEHGVASLRGRSLTERAVALAAVAAPEHRDSLLTAFRGHE